MLRYFPLYIFLFFSTLSKADVKNEITRTYMRDISLIKSSDGQLLRVYEGKVLCNFMKFVSTRKYRKSSIRSRPCIILDPKFHRLV